MKVGARLIAFPLKMYMEVAKFVRGWVGTEIISSRKGISWKPRNWRWACGYQ